MQLNEIEGGGIRSIFMNCSSTVVKNQKIRLIPLSIWHHLFEFKGGYYGLINLVEVTIVSPSEILTK